VILYDKIRREIYFTRTKKKKAVPGIDVVVVSDPATAVTVIVILPNPRTSHVTYPNVSVPIGQGLVLVVGKTSPERVSVHTTLADPMYLILAWILNPPEIASITRVFC